MRFIIFFFAVTFFDSLLSAQPEKVIFLNPPDTTRGMPLMQALAHRASESDFDTTDLRLQDLSDLLWAANGINRSDVNKRTAPSSQNAQDIDIYLLMKSAVYLYNAPEHKLELIVKGDFRSLGAGKQLNV